MRIGAVGDVRRYVFGLRKIVSNPATVGKLREYIATYVAVRYSGGIPFGSLVLLGLSTFTG